MTENIMMIALGALLIPLSVMNIKGNIQSIHWYNRTRITEETRKPYGKLMGIATLVIAIGLVLTGLLLFFIKNQLIHLIGVAGCIIGVAIMLYAQFKYNKGIF